MLRPRVRGPSFFLLLLAVSVTDASITSASHAPSKFAGGCQSRCELSNIPNFEFTVPFQDKKIELKLSDFERTYFAIGPLRLRSGVGLILGAILTLLVIGVGVGVGIGAGVGYPLTGSGGSFDSVAGSPLGSLLSRMPAGYTLMDLMRRVLRQFPGAQIGVGAGIGLGYGAGIGFTWGCKKRREVSKSKRDNELTPCWPTPDAPSHEQASWLATPNAGGDASGGNVTVQLQKLEERLASLEDKLDLLPTLTRIEESLRRLEQTRR